MKLQDIPKHFHIKRAIEVAMTGNHSLALIGSHESEAALFVEWVKWSDFPFPVQHLTPCPCGHFGSATKECTCSTPMINRHQGYQHKNQFDMYVEVPELTPQEIIDHLKHSRGENEDKVYERVRQARKRNLSIQLTDDDYNLLKAAISQLRLSYSQVKRILAVSQTIYHLSAINDQSSFSTAYLAEAIQYCRKG